MNRKRTSYIGLFIGSILGSMIASLLGAGSFSIWGIIISSFGAIAGLYIGFKLGA